MPLEDVEGIVRHSGQAELVVRDYEEHCASIPSDGISDQFDENVQVDLTMLAVTYFRLSRHNRPWRRCHTWRFQWRTEGGCEE